MSEHRDRLDCANQLVAFDDLFGRRLTHCSCCGRASSGGREGLWRAMTPGGAMAIAYTLCTPCVNTYGAMPQTLEATLRARYGVIEDNDDAHTQ